MCFTYMLCSTQCAALRAPAAATKPYPSAAARWLAWPQLASSPLIDLGSLAAPPAQADNVAHRTDKRDAANPNQVHMSAAPRILSPSAGTSKRFPRVPTAILVRCWYSALGREKCDSAHRRSIYLKPQ